MVTSRRRHALEFSAKFAGAVLIVLTAVLSTWAHHNLSTGQPASSTSTRGLPASSATAAPLSGPLRGWLDDAKSSIDALLITGNHLVATAAQGDIAGTAAACQTTSAALAIAQQHLPSPDPALNTTLQQAFTDYRMGIRHCISGTQKHDAIDIGQGAGFIIQGKTELQKAYVVIAAELASDPEVVTA